MSDSIEDVLTDEEMAILADESPVRLRRWDIEDPPDCHHCSRPARYALVLGRPPDGHGDRKKDVCDTCLERFYESLKPPLVARIFHSEHSDALFD